MKSIRFSKFSKLWALPALRKVNLNIFIYLFICIFNYCITFYILYFIIYYICIEKVWTNTLSCLSIKLCGQDGINRILNLYVLILMRMLLIYYNNYWIWTGTKESHVKRHCNMYILYIYLEILWWGQGTNYYYVNVRL